MRSGACFSWTEWAATLADEIKRAQAAGDPDTGETYYHHWLVALERVVTAKGVTTQTMLKRYHDAWDAAAEWMVEPGPKAFDTGRGSPEFSEAGIC